MARRESARARWPHARVNCARGVQEKRTWFVRACAGSPRRGAWRGARRSDEREEKNESRVRAGETRHKKQLMARPVVLYHCPCFDGAFAALAAYLHFQRHPPPAPPRFVGHRVTRALAVDDLSLRRDDTVYLLDYVGPAGFAAAVAERVKR